MAQKPYHKYVFDEKNRVFIGDFEGMYINEDREKYDSWYQEDLNHFAKQFSQLILNQYNFSMILDLGCGKGAFSNLLKKPDNIVIGVDISETAIRKASLRYKEIQFEVKDAFSAINLKEHFDLIVMMEILSYLKDWRQLLNLAAKKSEYVYISLFLPLDPIGFVKNFAELRKELTNSFEIETELLWNNEHIFLMAKSKIFI